MERDPRAYLWDVRECAATIAEFVRDKTFDDYSSNGMLRSAVERQFGIIGEALRQLSRLSPEIAARIPECSQVIGFRNILIHGYASIDHATVWTAIQDSLPLLEQHASELLTELGETF